MVGVVPVEMPPQQVEHIEIGAEIRHLRAGGRGAPQGQGHRNEQEHGHAAAQQGASQEAGEAPGLPSAGRRLRRAKAI